MNGGINYSEHFYQKVSQDIPALEKNANDFPYSSLAGFLLLYHYKKTNHPGFEKFAKRTTLHFQNELWLQFLLNQTPDEKTHTEITSSKYPEEEKKELNELNYKQETKTLSNQSSGNEIESVAENKVLPVENFEMIQQMDTIKSETVDEITEFSEGEIAFEPLHTVDYFASQGINLSGEPIPTDKLGNQMKSFTAWLKSMKKLHPSKLEEQDISTERIIQTSAEQSNISTDILTEAMAEVLIKQDKKEKAIEMFTKLSLINPSKSAYFAAKIDNIKSS